MKKISLCCMIAVVLLTGCVEKTDIPVLEKSGETTVFGTDALVALGNGLYYDSTTGIVYWWNGENHMVSTATQPTAYYAPNGHPYRYNPDKNIFEEITEEDGLW